MSEFVILNNPENSTYFDEFNNDNYNDSFTDKKEFFNELNKHYEPHRQTGYSKSKDCNFLAIVLIKSNYGDGEYLGDSFESTYLVNQDNKVIDVENNESIYGERGINITRVFHPLPDGKIMEFNLKKDYQDEIVNIWNDIMKARRYYELSAHLSIKPQITKLSKI